MLVLSAQGVVDVDLGLVIAGLLCMVLAFGHTVISHRRVLPAITADYLPRTRFGPPSVTAAMVRYTFYFVGLMALAFGILLLILGLVAGVEVRRLLLQWVAAFWVAATVMGAFVVRVRPIEYILRLRQPILFLIIAALSWRASL